MITASDKLAMDYRDSGIYLRDIPVNKAGNRCSRCGEKFANDSVVRFLTENSHGIDHYEYHKKCVKEALEHGNHNFQHFSPIKIPFKAQKRNFKRHRTQI